MRRTSVTEAVTRVSPIDAREEEHRSDVLRWINSDAQIYRVKKPAEPPKHLVSYFVLFDEAARSILLVDHINSGLWLPAGGHVEVDEDPWATVTREIVEELGVEAEPLPEFGTQPLFVTVTDTQGPHSHVDVSLWFVVKDRAGTRYDFDRREFRQCRWFTLDEVLSTDVGDLDPQMHRFVAKLSASL